MYDSTWICEYVCMHVCLVDCMLPLRWVAATVLAWLRVTVCNVITVYVCVCMIVLAVSIIDACIDCARGVLTTYVSFV